ncbi:MAG TPA: transcriptional regulator, partial [Nitrospirae bacterium]|nr:transcriptional regulator [Nitrospirota bacterium]
SRLKIIYALSKEELCVCDIASILGGSISAISHQLRILRNLRLVKFRKESKRVYYSLDDKHIKRLFDQGLKHVRE